jgi:uncharacterized RmlC-like cupin family protein
MSSSAAIHIVSPAEFDRATAQTPGSERRAAIAPALGIASPIWGGLFEVEPGSGREFIIAGNRRRSRTFFRASARFAGAKEEKRSRVQRPEILFMSAFLPHMEINPSNQESFRWVVVRSTAMPIVINLPDNTWP